MLDYLRYVDDPIDHYVRRPLAGRLVRLLVKTKITPNQVTLISVLFSLIAAVVFFRGDYSSLVIGALLLEIGILIDCVDGQLARAKNMGTKMGGIYDHTSDDVTLVCISIAVGTLLFRELAPSFWLWAILVSLGLLTTLLLASSQFFYAEELVFLSRHKRLGWLENELKEIRSDYRGKKWLRDFPFKTILSLYLFRLRCISFLVSITNPYRTYLRDCMKPYSEQEISRYHQLNQGPLRLWRFCGIGFLSFLLLIFCLLGRIEWFIAFLIIAGNLVFFVTLVLQKRADQVFFQMEQTAVPASP